MLTCTHPVSSSTSSKKSTRVNVRCLTALCVVQEKVTKLVELLNLAPAELSQVLAPLCQS
jgi:hypothetical protein